MGIENTQDVLKEAGIKAPKTQGEEDKDREKTSKLLTLLQGE